MILNYGDTLGRTIYTLLDQFTIELVCIIYLFFFKSPNFETQRLKTYRGNKIWFVALERSEISG